MRIALPSLARITALVALVTLASCVTINVYFPSAVAEQVADRFVQDVYGEDRTNTEPTQPSAPQSQSSADGRPPIWMRVLAQLVPAAHAAPNFDADSPAIRKLKDAMRERHEKLVPFYASGAIGMTANGLIDVRDLASVPLPKRNELRKLVADENADRNALYREIAKANQQPEWEPQIRDLFAERWIANAPAGWYYQGDGGAWKQK